MRHRLLIRRLGWALARFLWRMDRLAGRIFDGSRVIAWMEARGLCCDKHALAPTLVPTKRVDTRSKPS